MTICITVMYIIYALNIFYINLYIKIIKNLLIKSIFEKSIFYTLLTYRINGITHTNFIMSCIKIIMF